MNPDRVRAAIRTLYPDHITPTAKRVLEKVLDDENQAPVSAGAFSYPTKGEAMTENANTETIPDEHDEEICAGGETMCIECYAAGADHGDPS